MTEEGRQLKRVLTKGLTLLLGFGAVLWLGAGREPPAPCTPDDSLMTMAQAGQEEKKRVFLTFDDGPSATTETVLDVLKDEGVPATFFVIAAPNNERYLPTLYRTAAEGHQIALHSCSHEYREIYASPEAFWQDIKALKSKLSPYVGEESLTWLRFPGGSTNTVSHRYGGSGIMKTLKTQAEQAGYHYLDWNVCAEDAAGGHPDAQQIVRNIVEDVGEKKTCVVLMHDTGATAETARALPQIIGWFRENGYEFCRVEQLEEEN